MRSIAADVTEMEREIAKSVVLQYLGNFGAEINQNDINAYPRAAMSTSGLKQDLYHYPNLIHTRLPLRFFGGFPVPQCHMCK